MDLDELFEQLHFSVRVHSRHVASYTSIISEYLPEYLSLYGALNSMTFTQSIYFGGTCHDYGKLLLPILLTDMAQYKRHPELGIELLEKLTPRTFSNENEMNIVYDIIRFHHERPDGKGFPYSLKGSDIPVIANICAAADWLDYQFSLTARNCRDENKILAWAREQSGLQFFDTVVNCLECAWPRLIHYRDKWIGDSAKMLKNVSTPV